MGVKAGKVTSGAMCYFSTTQEFMSKPELQTAQSGQLPQKDPFLLCVNCFVLI